MAEDREETIVYVKCPYCGEDGFDHPGLKSHLLTDCRIFKETENIPRLQCRGD